MTNEQIIEKIVDMLCNHTLEEQMTIMDVAIETLRHNWEETSSSAWEGYEP
jgi:hypothetical protein